MDSKGKISSTAKIFSDISAYEAALERLAEVRKEIMNTTEQLQKLRLEEAKLSTSYKSPTEEAKNRVEKDNSRYRSSRSSDGG
jgi:regulator of replication initiation timing